MCLIKKYGMDLKRFFVTGHCVAFLKKAGTPLVDLCLFSGEGKPALLGGYAITPADAEKLGHDLILNSNRAKESSPEEKRHIADMYLINAYMILKDIDKSKAKKLKDTIGIEEVRQKDPELGYVG